MAPTHILIANPGKLTNLFFLILVFAILPSINSSCRRAEYLSVSGECCPMCQRGLVVRKDCTEFSSTSCIPCLDGTYMDEPNGYNKCHQCKTCDSGQGLKTRQKCTSTDDARCEVVDGYYCESFSSQDDCGFAVKHAVCTPGQRIKIPGSKTSDTKCEECPKGHYSPHGFNCTTWTDCSEIGKEKAEDGSPERDVECKDIDRHRTTTWLTLTVSLVIFFICGFVFYQRKKLQFKGNSSGATPLNLPTEETNQNSSSAPAYTDVDNIEETQSLQVPTPQSMNSDSAYGSDNMPDEIEEHEHHV